MKRTVSILTPGILGILALLQAPPAEAQSPKSLLEDGIYQYAIAEFESSVKLLKRAAKKTTDPKLLGPIHLYLGVNYAVMHRVKRARAAFRRALKHGPHQKLAPNKFKKPVIKLLASVRAMMKGRLEVTSTPPGALVFLDGKQVGTTRHRASLPVGVYQLEVRTTGGVSHSEQVTVAYAKTTEVNAKLVAPKPVAPKPVAPKPVAPKPVAPAASADGVSPTAPDPASTPARRRRLWTWIAAGAAVAAAGVGLGFGLSARSDYDEYQTTDDRSRFDELNDGVPRKALIANISFITAGALAITSAVLFFLEGRPGTDRAVSFVPTVGPGAAVGGQF